MLGRGRTEIVVRPTDKPTDALGRLARQIDVLQGAIGRLPQCKTVRRQAGWCPFSAQDIKTLSASIASLTMVTAPTLSNQAPVEHGCQAKVFTRPCARMATKSADVLGVGGAAWSGTRS